MIFQAAIRNGKAAAQPALLVRIHREDNRRVRFVPFAEKAAIFRHTYISRLAMAGVNLRTVQELAGHKGIKMTVRYAHLAGVRQASELWGRSQLYS